ncbi:MAG: hypothetical protein GY822_22240 [Deltaproteobacteria bacterium]|nr:hypothetical protein [Deltaproteobacteria bacterium]
MEAEFAILIEESRWRVTLSGDFTQEKASDFAEHVKTVLADDGYPAQVFMDLRSLEGFSVFGRTFLVQVQEEWRTGGARTAYLSSRPRFRGLGLWVCHLAEDAFAGSFVNEEDVESWLSSNIEREDEAREKICGGKR